MENFERTPAANASTFEPLPRYEVTGMDLDALYVLRDKMNDELVNLMDESAAKNNRDPQLLQNIEQHKHSIEIIKAAIEEAKRPPLQAKG